MTIERFALMLLLVICTANLWLTDQTPNRVHQLLGEEIVPTQTLSITANVTIGSVTKDIPIKVTTTQGENTPDNVHVPHEDETTAEWNKRTMDTLKKAYDDAVAYGG